MFKEKVASGADPFEVAQAIRHIRDVHEAFAKWLCVNMAPASQNEFSATMEGDRLVISTPAGQITSDLEFVRAADGETVGRFVFYEPEKKSFGLPVRPLFAVRLKGDFEVYSGDEDGHKWDRREHTGWLRREAERLGHELLLAQLTPRG